MEINSGGDCKVIAHMEAGVELNLAVGHRKMMKFECHDKDGNLLWTETIYNRVPTEGLNDALTKHLKGVAYTAAWFCGLVNDAGFSAFAAGDTAAQIGGSNGWTELTSYTQATRPALVLGTASGGSIDNVASVAVFTINATVNLHGGFIVSSSTKGGTGGVLYGEGAFASVQPAIAGNTITMTVVLTLVSL